MKCFVEIRNGVEAAVANGKLYLRLTDIVHGCLEQGGRLNRVVAEKYDGTLEDAQKPINDYGTTDIDCLIETDRLGLAEIFCHGTLI